MTILRSHRFMIKKVMDTPSDLINFFLKQMKWYYVLCIVNRK